MRFRFVPLAFAFPLVAPAQEVTGVVAVRTRDSQVFRLSGTFRFGAIEEEKEDNPLRYDDEL